MQNSRIYKIDELKTIKPGTVFEHETLGRCIVMRNRKGGFNYMVFKNGYPDAWFHDDNHPWNKRMKMVNAGD